MHPMIVHPTSSNLLKDLKAHIAYNTVVVGNFSATLSPVNRSSRLKISKEILDLNDTWT
jgi:hypothetical protein